MTSSSGDLRLIPKEGGKERLCDRGRHREPAPLYGLILAGGSSSRMQRDKAALPITAARASWTTFEPREPGTSLECTRLVRAIQTATQTRAQRPNDRRLGCRRRSRLAESRSALARVPPCCLAVLACDLPLLSDAALSQLTPGTEPGCLATAYR